MMITLRLCSALTLLCLSAGAADLQAQWDPKGDAKLFRYVFPYPGHYINDHTLIRTGSLWHLFFIDGKPGAGIGIDINDGLDSSRNPGARSWPTVDGEDPSFSNGWDRPGNEVRIGHATSSDLMVWTPQDSALGLGAPGALDGAHVYAPSVIEKDGIYYMIYTGNQVGFYGGEHLFLATSTDLYHWKRYQAGPIFTPDRSWAMYRPHGYQNGAGGPVSGRDPHILHDPRYGYILYYAARLRSDSAGVADGTYSCIAAATSPDLIHWTDRGPLVVRPTYKGGEGFVWNHPESPCVVRRNDLYYLFWKGGVGTRYLMSTDPLDFSGAVEHRLATSHASKVVRWGDEWYVTSCSRDVSDFAHAYTDRTRGLFLARLRWEGDLPRVAPLENMAGVAPDSGPRTAASLSPNPVRRGGIVTVRLQTGSSGGEEEVVVVDVRSGRAARLRVASVVDEEGERSVEIATTELATGIYFVRIGATVTRLIVH